MNTTHMRRRVWDLAITRDSSTILILQDNEIVGKARWVAGADGWTSMQITEGEALAWVEKISEEHGQGVLKAKHFNPRYFDFDGSYVVRGEEGGWGFLDDKFRGTRAVSEFALGYGMVPESFTEVPGYRRKLDESLPPAGA